MTKIDDILNGLEKKEFAWVEQLIHNLDEGTEKQLLDGMIQNKRNEILTSSKLITTLSPQIHHARLQAHAQYIQIDNHLKIGNYANALDIVYEIEKTLLNHLKEDEKTGLNTAKILLNAIKNYPKQAIENLNTNAEIAFIEDDPVSQLSIQIKAQEHEIKAIIDTGASLSAISRSLAKKLNCVISSESVLASGAGALVKSQFTLLPEFYIGDMLIKNTIFAVLDDEQLYLPSLDEQINFIIGMPVLRALEVVSFTPDKLNFTCLANKEISGDLYFDHFTPYLRVESENKPCMFTLDTGSPISCFFPPFYHKHPHLFQGLKPEKNLAQGVGGISEVEGFELPIINLSLGNQQIELKKISVDKEYRYPLSKVSCGHLGLDFLNQNPSYTFDFRRMKLYL